MTVMGFNCLYIAALNGRANVVKYFLDDVSMDVDFEEDLDGNTPLIIAAMNGHVETVVALLDRGADADFRNLQTRTPLWYAKRYNHDEVHQTLLDRGATSY